MPELEREPYVLGIDLGTNSVGWALIRLEDGLPAGIIRAGSRVFEAGMEGDIESGKEESRNLKRRQMRSQRRQTWRRARRAKKIFVLLQQFGLLPGGNATTPAGRQQILEKLDQAILNSEWFKKKQDAGVVPEPHQVLPYLLRAAGLTEKLEPPYFGRALYHLAQRRGFLSNRKQASITKNGDDEGAVKEGINQLREELSKDRQTEQERTLGEYFSQLNPHEQRIRRRWTARSMYENEFVRIWCAQARHHSHLTLERFRQLYLAVFHQRPLKISDDLIGRCELEPAEPRAPRYLFVAQRFRLLQEVNNLRLEMENGLDRPLTDDEREKLIQELELKGDRTFIQIRKLLQLPSKSAFTIERGGDKKVRGNRTTAAFYKVFGERWLNGETSAADHEQALQDVLTSEDDEALKRHAIEHWGLDEEHAREFSKISPEGDYFKFSRAAIEKMLPLLELRVTFAEARRRLYPEKFQSREPVELLPPLALDSVREAVGDIRNPIVTRTLTELRKVLNAIVRAHGKPEHVRVELARSLKNAKKVRKTLSDINRENEAERAEMAKKIMDHGGPSDPGPTDVRKAILWKECGGICPYTGKPIDFRHLFDGESQFDIEHIIPYDRCFDNSFKNLTLCYVNENRHVKGGKTPWEAYGSGSEYPEMLDRVRRFRSKSAREKLRRFQMTDTEAAEFISSFRARDLNDTRYASRLAAKYVAMLYGGLSDNEHNQRVLVSSGGVTAALRNAWMLNSILNDGATKNGGEALKTRDDHRHHAVDAVVIALTDAAAIQQLSLASQQARERGQRRPLLKAPWGKDAAEFVDSVRAHINQVVVSHRVSKKVSGALHEETIYSPPKLQRRPGGKPVAPAAPHVRKPLSGISRSEIDDIVDHAVRQRVLEKLAELGGGEPKKLFAIEANLPFLESRDGRHVPIKKVRVRKALTTFPLGTGKTARHVVTESNHHVEILAELDLKGNEAGRDGAVISMAEAYQRKKSNLPVVNRSHEPGLRFLFSLAPGEVLELEMKKNEPSLWVVRSFSKFASGQIQIGMVPISDSRKKAEIVNSQKFIRPGPDTLRQWKARKVVVSPLGRCRTPMTDRILDLSDRPASLSVRNLLLVIQLGEEQPVTVPLDDLAVVITSHPQISYTHAVLAGLAGAGAAFCVRRETHAGRHAAAAGDALPANGAVRKAGRNRPPDTETPVAAHRS